MFFKTFPDFGEASDSTATNAEVIESNTDSHNEHRNDMISIKAIDTMIVNIES